MSETVEHYHEERPHQSLGNEPPVNRQTTETPNSDADETKLRIVCRERLGRAAQALCFEGRRDLFVHAFAVIVDQDILLRR